MTDKQASKELEEQGNEWNIQDGVPQGPGLDPLF